MKNALRRGIDLQVFFYRNEGKDLQWIMGGNGIHPAFYHILSEIDFQ
jgi:hypothetical protein